MRLPLTLLAGVVLLTSACSSDAGGEAATDFAGEQIRIIVPTEPGGGIDSTLRQLEPFLSEALGATITVENVPGGNSVLGTQRVLSADGDCLTLLGHNVPHIAFSYLVAPVDYTLADFAPIAGVTTEPGVIRVGNDAPWNSLEDLVADARARPGQIRFSVSDLASSNFLGLLQIQEELGVEFNIVPYDGGGPARTALVAGEVEATHAGVFNSASIADTTRVLAVHDEENLWADVTDDAPTVNEALGVDLPPQSSRYSLFAPATCAAESPERYQLLVDTVEQVLGAEDYLAALEALDETGKVSYQNPEELRGLIESAEQEIGAVLATDANAFGG